MELGTLVVSVLAGLGSGALGAWLTAQTQTRLARENRRHEAAVALLNYQRVLHDYMQELEALNYDDEVEDWTPAARAGQWSQGQAWESIHNARVAAWPYKGRLGREADRSIEDGAVWLLPPSDPNEAVEQVSERLQALQDGLRESFPDHMPPIRDKKGRLRA